jgi:hypothetical protein
MRYSESLLRWTPALPEEATLCSRPHFITEKRRRGGAKAAGQRYERKIHKVFDQLYGPLYLPSQWYKYRAVGARKWSYCQTDGLLFDVGQRRIIVVEIKLKHTPAALVQLYTKYLPVVCQAFGGEEHWSLALCEVVRWYDPGIKFPIPVHLTKDPTNARPQQLSVHICNPDRSQFKAQHKPRYR